MRARGDDGALEAREVGKRDAFVDGQRGYGILGAAAFDAAEVGVCDYAAQCIAGCGCGGEGEGEGEGLLCLGLDHD